MRYLSVNDALVLHIEIIRETGGASGVADEGLLESAIHRPRATFGGCDLYETVEQKAGALIHSLVLNHPFLDGNKRAGFAAMNVFLRLNGYRLTADHEEIHRFVLDIAEGKMDIGAIVDWIKKHSGNLSIQNGDRGG